MDFGKAIKKASITLAQVLVSAVLSFGLVQQAFGVFHFTPTPEQVLQIQLAVAGVIAWALEFLRSTIKQKFNLSWL